MNIHKNARLTPKGRAHLISEIERIGLTPAAAAAEVSSRTARKWHKRHQQQGANDLADRSSRPRRSPKRTCSAKAARVVRLRQRQRLTYACIAERVGLSTSTVGRICKAAGANRLPPLQQRPPVRRYERKCPGELLHLDTKKLARFDRPGHRLTGDRTRYTAGAGWQALHVAIDDHSRVGFSQMLPDETAGSACQHLMAALRYYKHLGVRVTSVMTDNGSAYTSRRFAKLLRRLGIRHLRTKPYTPERTARPSASFRRCSQSGPTRIATPPQDTGQMSCRGGCITTISTDRIRLPSTNLPSLAWAWW